MPNRRCLVFAGTLLLIALDTVGAQEYAPNERGAVTMAGDHVSPDIPAAQVRAALKATDTLIAILKKTELFRNPIGININLTRYVLTEPVPWQAGRPYYYGVETDISYLVWRRDYKGDRLLDNGTTLVSSIDINGIPCVPHHDDVVAPDGGPPVSESRDGGARITGEFRGHAVYSECVFMTRQAGSPLAPLTKERYMRLQILRLQKRVSTNRANMGEEAERPPSADSKAMVAGKAPVIDCDQLVGGMPGDAAAKKKLLDQCKDANAQGAKVYAQSQASVNAGAPAEDSSLRAARVLADTGMNSQVRALQALLAAMPASERRRQAAAYVDARSGERLSDVDSVDTFPLVQLNARFFDNSLQPTVPQVVGVSMPDLQPGIPPSGFGDGTRDESKRVAALGARLRDQLDWTALEALVRKTIPK